MVSEILLLPYEGNQMKEKLRPFYSELNGYLSQAPIVEKQSDLITDEDVWTQYNKTVNSICNISQEDLSRFLIKNIRDVGVGKSITLISYKQKLGGLISYLHSKYFPKEPAPFCTGPSTVISQSQQQNQSVHIHMLLEIQSKIDEKIHGYKEGSKEKSFLQKLKSSLGSISNTTQLISQLLTHAKDFGLSFEDILKIFK